MHMDFHDIVVRHHNDRIADRFQIRLEIHLHLNVEGFVQHNDKFRAIAELDIRFSLRLIAAALPGRRAA